MRLTKTIIALAVIAAAVPDKAMAADWSADLGLTGDYRYRGLSLSGGKPALQATLGAELKSGLYGELWGSTIANDGAGRIELDATAGYAVGLTDALSLDLSATFYGYPGHAAANALELTVAAEGRRGPLTARLGLSVAPPQTATRDDDGRRRTNVYAFASASLAVPHTALSLRAELGREQGPWDMRGRGAKWDYALGLDAALEPATVSLDLVGSNAGADGLVGGVALHF